MLLRWPVLVILVACVDSSSVMCPDGSLCPSGAVCAVVDDTSLCVPPDDITVCLGKDAFAECGVDLRCYQGVCLSTGCGNTRLEPGEVCDDGNNGAGDGCSADCQSNETCGNGVVDLIGGEQCDDGPGAHPRSHDGCASDCSAEAPRWFLYPDLVEAAGSAWTYDHDRKRMVLFSSIRSVAETWEFDGHRWMRRLPNVSPVPRNNHGLAYDVINKRVILFGGDAFNDTWAWDGVTWSVLAPPTSPPARHHHVMTTDTLGQRIILYGGVSPTTLQPLDDTWAWDGATWTQLPSPDAPSPRLFPSLAYDPGRDVTVLFGGYPDPGDDSDETWELTGSTWVRKTPTSSPPARRGALLAYDPTAQAILMHSGFSDGIGNRTDTWLYDGTTWSMHPQPGPAFTTASLAGTLAHGAHPILVDRGRTYRFDDGWTTIENAVVAPVAVASNAAAAVDLEGRRFVSHGGLGPGGALQSTQIWTGVWQRLLNLSPGSSPGRIYGAAMAYDARRNQFVLFGGVDDATNTASNQTWTFDGAVWTQRTLQTPPSELPERRTNHVLVYDAARERVVLFGGFGETSYLDDTWEWDGAQWAKLTPPSKPPPRAFATASYDPIREVTILFGGNAGPFFGDTWEWDGVTWQMVASQGPVPRSDSGMAWDAARARTILFGGATAIATLNDQWEWNGATWTQLAALDTLRPRAAHSMFSSLDGNGVMVWGGANQGGSLIAELALLQWRGGAPEEICDGRDRDGDLFDRCSDPDCWRVCTPLCPPGATANSVCGAGAVGCGDLVCNPFSETCATCPGDCGVCP